MSFLECEGGTIGECVPRKGRAGKCSGLSEERCWAKRGWCKWECRDEPTEIPDDKVGLGMLEFLPGNRMPFNERLSTQQRNCNIMAQGMLQERIPFATVIRKVVKAYNVNEDNPTLQKSGVAKWDSQRNACLNGIRKVYGRPLKKWDRYKQDFVELS